MIKIAIALEKPIDYFFPDNLFSAIKEGVFHRRLIELTESETKYITGKYRANLITDGGIEDVINKVDGEELEGKMNEVLGTLTAREERIIRQRFGLDDGKSKTLEEVGNEFKVSKERIRQIESKALRKLRYPSRARMLKEFHR